MKGLYFYGILVFIIFPKICIHAQADEQKITLLFIGDIMCHDEQIRAALNTETQEYNFDEVFNYIKPFISETDLAVANLELTLAGAPYRGYPRFSSPAELAAACKNAGIDCLVTANNHSADNGRKGISGTITRLDSIGIGHTGTYPDYPSKDSLEPYIFTRNGISVALLNYTFGTNGLRVPYPMIVNSIDSVLIAGDIALAEAKDPSLVVIFLHWGSEYSNTPSEAQEKLAEYLISKGADIIIGSHPHVLQKMVWNKPQDNARGSAVIYSLGNFVSNQARPGTDGGSMVRIEVSLNEGQVSISDIGYYLTWVYTPVVNGRKKYFILPCSEYENSPGFFMAPEYFERMKKFISGSRSLLQSLNVNVSELLFNGSEWLHKD